MRVVFFLATTFILLTGFTFKDDDLRRFAQSLNGSRIVLVGELHTLPGHKELLLQTLEHLVASGTVDTIGLEAVAYENSELLNQYLLDSRATPNSDVENHYLERISSRNGEMGTDGKNCCWSYIFDPNYRALFQLLKKIKNRSEFSNRVKFCGLDFNDNYSFKKKTVDEDWVNLPSNYASLVSSMFGGRKDLGVLRELWMSSAIDSCIQNRKRGIFFIGASHAVRIHHPSVKSNVNIPMAMLSDILSSRFGAASIKTILNTSPRPDNTLGEFGPKLSWTYQSGINLNEFGWLPTNLVIPTLKLQWPLSSQAPELGNMVDNFDFIVYGPTTQEFDPRTGAR